mgnify:CR=1 FL=1
MNVIIDSINNSRISEKNKRVILKMLDNISIQENTNELKDAFDKIIEKECR